MTQGSFSSASVPKIVSMSAVGGTVRSAIQGRLGRNKRALAMAVTAVTAGAFGLLTAESAHAGDDARVIASTGKSRPGGTGTAYYGLKFYNGSLPEYRMALAWVTFRNGNQAQRVNYVVALQDCTNVCVTVSRRTHTEVLAAGARTYQQIGGGWVNTSVTGGVGHTFRTCVSVTTSRGYRISGPTACTKTMLKFR